MDILGRSGVSLLFVAILALMASLQLAESTNNRHGSGRHYRAGYLNILPSTTRNLQTINLLKRDEDTLVEGDTTIFSNGGAQPGSGATVACRVPTTFQNADGTYNSEETLDTKVNFVYEVEFRKIEVQETYTSITVALAVDETNIKFLALELCTDHPCIIGFSVDVPDQLISNRDSSYCLKLQGSGSCYPYSGSINVWHSIEPDGGCNATEIKDLVLGTLDGKNDTTTPATRSGVMNESAYIDDVNDWTKAFPPSTVTGDGNVTDTGDGNFSDVILVTIVPGDKNESVAGIAGTPPITTSDGLSPAAWVLLALLALLLLLLLWLLCRHCRKDKEAEKKIEDDLKSLRTTWSNSNTSAGGKSFASGSNGSYMTADMHNLALQHSKLDVHKCKSATCEICRSNIGKVDMLPVGQSDASAARALAMSSLREEMEDEEEPLNAPPPPVERRRVPTPPMEDSVASPMSERRPLEPEDDSQQRHSQDEDLDTEFGSTQGVFDPQPQTKGHSQKEVLL
ncbi:hypothetical protein ACA910_019284 [Epithemia clementina (nom. ined.)]